MLVVNRDSENVSYYGGSTIGSNWVGRSPEPGGEALRRTNEIRASLNSASLKTQSV